MKKVLFVCAGGLDATDPASKEMRFLANELSKQYDVSFLTTYLWKRQKRQTWKRQSKFMRVQMVI